MFATMFQAAVANAESVTSQTLEISCPAKRTGLLVINNNRFFREYEKNESVVECATIW